MDSFYLFSCSIPDGNTWHCCTACWTRDGVLALRLVVAVHADEMTLIALINVAYWQSQANRTLEHTLNLLLWDTFATPWLFWPFTIDLGLRCIIFLDFILILFNCTIFLLGIWLSCDSGTGCSCFHHSWKISRTRSKLFKNAAKFYVPTFLPDRLFDTDIEICQYASRFSR